MKIVNLNEYPEFFRGCGAPGRRMTDKLVELFSTADKYLWRALCPSGVRLDFITDSAEIEYTLKFGKSVRQRFSAVGFPSCSSTETPTASCLIP